MPESGISKLKVKEIAINEFHAIEDIMNAEYDISAHELFVVHTANGDDLSTVTEIR